MFKASQSNSHNVFEIKFENGYTISINNELNEHMYVDISIWDIDDFVYDFSRGFDNKTYINRVQSNELAEWINRVSNF